MPSPSMRPARLGTYALSRMGTLARRTHWALATFEALGVIVVVAQIFLRNIREKSINVQAFVAALVTAGNYWHRLGTGQTL